MKRFYEMQNVGRSKYVVNFHDGEKKHADGSDFFDVRIFSNNRSKERFVKELQTAGYLLNCLVACHTAR